MKPALLLPFLLLLAGLAAAKPAVPLNLIEAVAANTVSVEARAQGLGPGKLGCTITNLSGRPVRLRVPPGLRFAAADERVQDIFTFEEKLLTLAPGARQQVPLWAFCMEKRNSGPGPSTTYAFSGYARQGLQPLGDSLQKYPALAEDYGQMFVWALSDAEPLRDVAVAPTLVRGAGNIMRYISRLTRGPAGRVRSSTAGEPTVKTFTKRAFLLFHSPRAAPATLRVYGPNGQIMYDLFTNSTVGPGVVHYTFGINTIVDFADVPAYTIRLLTPAGKVLKELKVDANTPETDPGPPARQEFTFHFSLAKPVRDAYFRVRLPDGTLVEDVFKRPYLPAGKFEYELGFYHLYPPGTTFVARLETQAGALLREQPIAASAAR